MPNLTRCILVLAGLCAIFGPNAAQAAPLPLRGVNLSGAEFGSNVPGTYNTDYTYPTHGEVDYFSGKGMNVFRLAFRWERLQRSQNSDLDAAEIARVDDFVNYATGKGAKVILDPHNFARYYGQVIGQGVPASAFADFWSRLATRYKSNSRIIFGLMNEPHDMPTELWRDDANAAIAAIRANGATNLILVPGSYYDGAWSWLRPFGGVTANGTAMLGIVDTGNNFAFEVHQYMDGDYSGTSDACTSPTVGRELLQEFTAWLKANNRKGFLGEFAGGRNATCDAAVDGMLDYVEENPDVWLGWTWWSAGPWWGEYQFTLEPLNGADRPQMAILLPHLAGGGPRPPHNVSLDPGGTVSNAVGKARTFRATYSDPDGYANIRYVYLQVKTGKSGVLRVAYDLPNRKLYILGDSGKYIGGVRPGANTILRSSRGAIACKYIKVRALNPTTMQMDWVIAAAAPLAGATYPVLLYVSDKSGLSDGFDQEAMWQITSAP